MTFRSFGRAAHCIERPLRRHDSSRYLAIIAGCFVALGFAPSASGAESTPNVGTAAKSDPAIPADAPPAIVRAFLQTHCTACHGEKKHKAGVRFDTLAPDFSNRAALEQWLNAMDAVNAGDMPPEEEPQPKGAEISAFTGWIAEQARLAEARRHSAGGRVVLRRLNRAEYANTIRDLLGVEFNTEIEFPIDEKRHGFDRLGASLTVSPSHLEKYAEAAGKILDRAIVTGPPPKKEITRRQGEEYAHDDDKTPEALERVKKFRYLSGLHKEGFGYPDIESVGHGALIRSLGMSFGHLPASADGDYILRVRAYGVPFEGVTPRMGIHYAKPAENTKSYFAVDVTATAEAPQVYEFRLPLKTSFVKWANSSRTSIGIANDTRISGGGEWRLRKPEWIARHKVKKPLPDLYAPQIFVDWMELEGPLNDPWPPAGHTRIFPQGESAAKDAGSARAILERFMAKAFRRPLNVDDVRPVMAIVEAQLASGRAFVDAVKSGLEVVLCAPEFLYLVEDAPTNHLTDHQLAARLSYFLWSSMPDDALTALADAGRLRDPATLRAEVKRLLADPKAERFVDNFAGQWLELGRVGQFQPDPKLFPAWDDNVQQSAIGETKAFFREVLQRDLSVLNFLDSNWSMLNETMARFYGIDGVQGGNFRRVSLPAEAHRGGVLTQAAILGLTSDGTRTRPVHRGVWLLENIFATPPQPPPPDVPEIEPNVPGSRQLTVRERLEKHRSLENCAACHAKIDPLGFAFESYNAIGQWRPDEPDTAPLDPPKHAVDLTAKKPATPQPAVIIAAGQLPDGRKFANAEEFKKLLVEDSDKFLHALTEKLFIYSLGREIEFSDRETMRSLQAALKKEPTLRSLITHLVLTPAFQTK